jgi:ATP-binding cassette subfamily C protein PrsD
VTLADRATTAWTSERAPPAKREGVRACGTRDNPARAAFASARWSWTHVAVFSALVNILMLTGSIYMLQVYDRVLASRSIATLVGVSIIALVCFVLQGYLDTMRMRMLSRIGAKVDQGLSPLTARAAVTLQLRGRDPVQATQPIRDLDAIRTYLAGLGPTAVMDMPFVPVFVIAAFVLHPWLGWFTVASVVVIVALTLATERASKKPTERLISSGAERTQLAESGRRNAEAVVGLGMQDTHARRYDALHRRHVQDQLTLTDTASGLGAVAKTFRFVMQSATLGLGAWLAIRGELSPGAMIAASILVTRALAPVEVAIAYWKSFVAARQGRARLEALLPELERPAKALELPKPRASLVVRNLSVLPPGGTRATVQGASFELGAGQGLGLIGPSGSGKSSLARALVGVWPVAQGLVALDGASIDQWDPKRLGAFRGYLPQDVELFDGTIAENIARFQEGASSGDIIEAAELAGAHAMIVSLPEGYERRVGDGGAKLSGGQRQRVALARALFGNPFLVVLDEPNAHLDSEGDEALARAIRTVRERGGVVVVVTHRPSGLTGVDQVAVMANGRIEAMGQRDEILRKVMRGAAEGQGARPAGRAASVAPATAERDAP